MGTQQFKVPHESSLTPGALYGSLVLIRDLAEAGGLDAVGVFANAPVQRCIKDPMYGYYFFDRFSPFNKSAEAWILTQATTGTGVADTLPGGGAAFDAGAVTDGQGPQIQLAGTPITPAAGKDIWFECRLKDSFITGDLFVGLAPIDTTLMASSDMTTSNHIGFSCVTGDGILLCDANKAGVRVATTPAHTLVADTFVKLGFRVRGVTDITFFVNDQELSTLVLTANIPVVGLTPSFSIHATGTNRDVVKMSYIRCLQLL
jgi:hypothetical protein